MSGGAGLIWTVMPLEVALQGLEPDLPASVEAVIEGRLMQVLPTGDGMAVVQRLLSSDPRDYLEPRWQPGERVHLP